MSDTPTAGEQVTKQRMLNSFIDNGKIKSLLNLHKPEEDKDYLIGIFMTGAYQEALGNLHNLFGSTNVVHIDINQDLFCNKSKTHNKNNNTTKQFTHAEFIQHTTTDLNAKCNRRRIATIPLYRLLTMIYKLLFI